MDKELNERVFKQYNKGMTLKISLKYRKIS